MNNKFLTYHSLNTDVASLILRLLFGGLMISHGLPKLMGYESMSTQFPDLIGIGSELSLILVIFAELLCGILVLIGLYTRLASIPIFIAMMVAFFIAHAQDPFQVKELALVFLILAIVIFILGSGKYSVDYVLNRNKSV